jgi:hypothetical protein
LSDRLVEAQRPIRILDAIKWDDAVEEAFFAKDAKELPPVTADYYAKRPLPFDPDRKRTEFQTIERDIRRQLGPYNAAGQIMSRMCEEYREVVDLLVLRQLVGQLPCGRPDAVRPRADDVGDPRQHVARGVV